MSEVFQNRPYDTSAYLVIPVNPFRVRAGSLLPPLKVFIYSKTNLFGDPTPLGISGFTIDFMLYNTNGVLITTGVATLTDTALGEISYNWGQYDLQNPGNYFGDFVFNDTTSGKSFTIPTKERLQVLVY